MPRSQQPGELGGDLVRADRAGGGVAGHEEFIRRPRQGTIGQSPNRILVEPREDLLTDHGRRSAGAQAEAVDGLHLDPLVTLEQGRDPVDAARLAGLGAAQFDDGAAVGRAFQVMIESDDAVHFRARQIQHFGDDRHGTVGDMTERRLDIVQDGQQGALPVVMPAEDLLDVRGRPCLFATQALACLFSLIIVSITYNLDGSPRQAPRAGCTVPEPTHDGSTPVSSALSPRCDSTSRPTEAAVA